MTEAVVAALLTVFVLFCRVGACLMVLPGFASRQLPARVRLLIAMAYTFALAPLIGSEFFGLVLKSSFPALLKLIVAEIEVGLMIGICGRIFFLALEFTGSMIATLVGYGGTPGISLEETEPGSTLTSMITLTATVLVFVSDLPIELLRALMASYQVLDVQSQGFDSGMALKAIVEVSSKVFLLAVQIGSPFILYSILVNLLFSLANKLMPQVPIYFVSIPFVISGGLALLVLAAPDMLMIFMQSFKQWMLSGSP